MINVLVKKGDTISKDQGVIEIETDKATIEVPSSVEGKIVEVKVKTGDKVKVGQILIKVESTSVAPAEKKKSDEVKEKKEEQNETKS